MKPKSYSIVLNRRLRCKFMDSQMKKFDLWSVCSMKLNQDKFLDSLCDGDLSFD